MNELVAFGNSPIQDFKGVGLTTATMLSKLNIHTMRDLLLHLPVRYQDRVTLVKINQLRRGQEATIAGTLLKIIPARGRGRITRCQLQDDTGTISLVFFHFRKAGLHNLHPGTVLRCFGLIRQGKGGLEMAQPAYKSSNGNGQAGEENGLTPVYNLTKGLSQNRLRQLIRKVLAELSLEATDPLDALFADSELPSVARAIHLLHQPPLDTNIPLLAKHRLKAHQRLAWEELLAQIVVTIRLKNARQAQQARALKPDSEKIDAFLERLPFQPTDAQNRAINELLADLAQTQPMLRLLQGDVGSGKTLVATMALLAAVETKGQAAFMVPTEILSQQHAKTLTEWQLPVFTLTSHTTRKKRRLILEQIASGVPCIVVGTHSLFQEDVQFANLVLIVIDEQHKFGVHQRLALQEKGEQPHRLIMTATPIPRTLAMSLYADLSVSILNEMPKGRQPIITAALPKTRNMEVMQRIRAVCLSGQQAYWICPFIEISEDAEDVSAAQAVQEELVEKLPELRIGLLHGRLPSPKKASLMAAFQAMELDVLVATTVVEVGIDVPRATIVIIENAERLGLAQMHQLRGRVGRGQATSYCVLLYQPPLSDNGKKRLEVMRTTTDGFQIAEKDLELRGAGELLGSRQTGRFALRIANLMAEAAHLPYLKKLADQAIDSGLADEIVSRWLPEAERLGQA